MASSKRKVATHKHPKHGVIAHIYRDSEWQEWSVRHVSAGDGRRLGEYFAIDKKDAVTHASSSLVASFAAAGLDTAGCPA